MCHRRKHVFSRIAANNRVENNQQSKITISKGRGSCNQGLVSRWGLAPTVFRYETSLGGNPETLAAVPLAKPSCSIRIYIRVIKR